MIELPFDVIPNGVEVESLDFGMLLRPAAGASPLRVNRPGARLRVRVSFPPMPAEVARVVNSRLMTARREGLRIDYPLLGVDQGAPGDPVVDGDDPAGTTLPMKGLTPGYAVREGYVLTLVDVDGNRFTHFAASADVVDSSGEVVIEVEPPIRGEFSDGDTILLGRPTIEGLVVEDYTWSLSVDQLVRGAVIVIEESAGIDPVMLT